MAGFPPFESNRPMEVYSKVVKGIGNVKFPKRCKGNLEQLVKDLCNTSPNERLPMKMDGLQRLKSHKWYEGFDWNAMLNLTMTPPYVPRVKNKKDLANFCARDEDRPPQLPYKDDKSGW